MRVIVCFALFVMLSSQSVKPAVSRFVCLGCQQNGQFQHLFTSRRAANIHVGMTKSCRTLGLGVREIHIAAMSGGDVMAGGGGSAGPAPDVRHQPPGAFWILLFYVKLLISPSPP
jgi:hypothetical protein